MIRYIASGDPGAAEAFGLLRRVGAVAPWAVERVFDHPAVGAWATRVALGLRDGGGGGEGLAFVAAAAAVRAGVACEVGFPDVEVFVLPSLGVAPGGPGDLTVVPYPEIDLGGVVLQVDQWVQGGVPVDLPVAAEVDLETWRAVLGAAWGVLARDRAGVAAEFAAAVSVVTPMPSVVGGTTSATVSDAVGCVFLASTGDAEVLAVVLAHETQHTKLAALMDLFPLVRDTSELFYAPWRDDPRPAVGLLHGTYAHLGVAGFWRGRGGERALVEYARWRGAALTGAEALLGAGVLTEVGREFVEGMASVLRGWCGEELPGWAVAAAVEKAREHRDRWRVAHG
ncbi:HEXXH motif-containing putative peptide modification protein [Actinosynnema sp. NPDC020468]|uniref:aKG-HExxH-type peptide beta-hydroxylase n=1 Tax=Actinosynnema sp. NPDC020468 TaxID=3154488 RepID=UPI0033E26BBB